MNRTTGDVATALSMAALVSVDRRRSWRGVRMERRGRKDLVARGRADCRRTEVNAGLRIILIVVWSFVCLVEVSDGALVNFQMLEVDNDHG